MTVRKLIVEMYAANRGRAASTAQIKRYVMLHGYAGSAVYKEIQRMLAAGQLRATGAVMSRMLHSTPTTAGSEERQKPGPAPGKDFPKKAKKQKKTQRVREHCGPRDTEDADDKPFVHRIVSSREWRLHASAAQATRWVFDLVGRA